MLEYMLDTDVCIYAMTRKSQELRPRFLGASGRMCVSSITVAELHYGAMKSLRQAENLEVIDEFLGHLVILDFDREAAIIYGEIRAALERAGTPCGANDMLIGAHALSERLTLVTNNRREFDRMPGLRVEPWV